VEEEYSHHAIYSETIVLQGKIRNITLLWLKTAYFTEPPT